MKRGRYRVRDVRGATALAVSALALSIIGASAPFGTASILDRTTFFQSPSHNIACAMTSEGVRCDIRDHSWKAPPKPASCDVDYGGGLSLIERGKGHDTCAGDTLLGSGEVLAYGRSEKVGRFRCTSKMTGVKCVNRRNGHGFKLATASVRLF